MIDIDGALVRYDDAYKEFIKSASQWLVGWLGGADEKTLKFPVSISTIYLDVAVLRGVKKMAVPYGIVFVYDNMVGEEDYILLEEVPTWFLASMLGMRRNEVFG